MISLVNTKVHKVLKVQRVLRFLECADERWRYHLIRGPLEPLVPLEPFTQKKSSHISLNLTALLPEEGGVNGKNTASINSHVSSETRLFPSYKVAPWRRGGEAGDRNGP